MQGSSSPATVNSSRVQHFRHLEPAITRFEGDKIHAPADRLTLVIRTDTHFATRRLNEEFLSGQQSLTQESSANKVASSLPDIVESAYQKWGTQVVTALVASLDYERVYGLSKEAGQQTNIHFHSADSLAGAVIKKTEAFLDLNHPEATPPLYVSLDDMIHGRVFRRYVKRGHFAEVGFSRLFSLTGEEVGFVGRPGKGPLEEQIAGVQAAIQEVGGTSKNRTPIILLEDNVRRAKTLLWIFNKMQAQGVMNSGFLAGVATCFSVATPEERGNIRLENKEVPLLVGVDYTGSRVDVVTPRDHLFDGFVVRSKGEYGRLPSFVLPADRMAQQFKLHPKKTKAFMELVYNANINFCRTVEDGIGISPPLSAFTPGQTIASVFNITPETPMIDVLERARAGKLSSFHLVK